MVMHDTLYWQPVSVGGMPRNRVVMIMYVPNIIVAVGSWRKQTESYHYHGNLIRETILTSFL